MHPILKRIFNRYFFSIASLLNVGGHIIAYESDIHIDINQNSLRITYIDLQHSEIIEGSTAKLIEILNNNKITKNTALKLSDIKTRLSQRNQHSVITLQAKINDLELLLDRLSFFYQNNHLVYKRASNERILNSNGTPNSEWIEFPTDEIKIHMTRQDDPELHEDWIQLSGKPSPLNDILNW